MSPASVPRCLATVLLWSLLTLSTVSAEYQPFNCRRQGTSCDPSATCRLDGKCPCPADRSGDDCGLDRGDLAPQMCLGRACKNGGSCYYNGTVHKCYCTSGFYGERCEKYRVSVECRNNTMVGFVYPFVSTVFAGKIYVFNQTGVKGCQFQHTSRPGYAGYELSLALTGDGPCTSSRTVFDDRGNMVYQYRVIVRYNSVITSHVDESHTLQCEFKLNGTLTASTSTGFDETVAQQLTGTNARRGYQPVTLRIMTVEDEVVARAVQVGDQLYLEFDMPENELNYIGYVVDSCIAYSTEGNMTSITQEFPMLENSCPMESATSVVNYITSEDNRRITKLYFRAFKFDVTSLVHFVCQVSLCSVNSTNTCDFNYTTCENNVKARRRRETITRYLLTDVIGQSMIVTDNDAQPATGIQVAECDLVVFYIVLAVLAVFSLLAFICAIYLCFKMARRRRRYDTVVVRQTTLPDGQVIRRVEEVHPADNSSSSDRGPIIRP